jgi:hypothetical protein
MLFEFYFLLLMFGLNFQSINNYVIVTMIYAKCMGPKFDSLYRY